jgi:histidine triad (HIT) family protein
MPSKDCVFCKIVRGELPAWKILENNDVIGILDTNPSAEGHCLIIPKKHVHRWHDLNDAETSAVFNAARLVAKQIKKKCKPDFVCVFIRGGRVKHTHVVLFPSHEGDKLSGFPQSVLGRADIDFKSAMETTNREHALSRSRASVVYGFSVI